MGLLEDAIREHLALKRQHGADPGEVTAQEREALGPIQRGVEPLVLDREPAPEDAPAAHDEPVEDLPQAAEPDLVPEYEPPPASPPPADPTAPFDIEDEPFAPEPPPEPEASESDEDVLEETPDFLQETPEHDRLWFEQKPPRDFDFDR
ncbi:MAG: hypothetical protein ACJ76K_03925 [Solirubrobacteraceae bacterium]|jgi:hypothetical protein